MSKKPIVNARWFKDQLNLRGLNQREAAEQLGLAQPMISHMFTGRRRITLSEAVDWSILLHQPLEDVLTNAGISIPPDTKTPLMGVNPDAVDVVGWVDKEFSVVLGRARGPQTVQNPIPGALPRGEIVALRFQTGGFFDGALAYYRNDADGVLFHEALERNCVVKIASGKTVVRVLKRGYEAGRHDLYKLTGEIGEAGVVVEWASPIMWLKL